MKRNRVVIIVIVVHIIMIFGWKAINEYAFYKEKVEGGEIIIKIKEFIENHGRSPDTLEEIGLKPSMTVPPFYSRINENQYSLSYLSRFDAGIYYDSRTGEWVKL